MERKIGEIFEHEGEWYQCVESDSCGECSLFTTECGSGTKSNLADKIFGQCSRVRRSDNKHAIFKKLEKVGEPYSCNYYGDNRLIMMQEYNLFNLDDVTNEDKIPMYITDYNHKRIAIELKQNQKDIEEKKSNLKPFSLEAAKAGKPVCTRDGRKARIICFDRKGIYSIVALIDGEQENIQSYTNNGRLRCTDLESELDLMMLPEKHEGWINVIKNQDNYYYCKGVFDTEEYARNNEANYTGLAVATVKIEWEE